MVSPWSVEFWRFVAVVLVALLAGWILDAPWRALLIGLAVYSGWHALHLWRLHRWLTVSRRAYPPEAGGVWGEIYDQFYHLRRRNRQREQRLAAIVREFQQSTEAMPNGTVVLSPDGRIVWFNPAAARLLRLRLGEDAGLHVVNLVRHPDFVAYFNAGQFDKQIDIDSPFEDGVRLGLQVIPYGESQRLLIVHDLTRLYQLERIRRDFVANASHELRTPLTVITGYLEAMHEDAELVNSEWGGPVEKMRRQAVRMEVLLRDLLMLSKLEADLEPANAAPVAMASLITDICHEGRVVARSGAELHCGLDHSLMVLGNEHELRSVVSNLVNNAVKYSPDGGEVIIRWYPEEGEACLSVEDHGIGIPAKHIPRLTERFYRVDEGRSRDQGGTGLGLSIVRHALGRHGATLEIESEPGRGSLFRCRFPSERVIISPRSAAASDC